jgi:hypothetical protein
MNELSGNTCSVCNEIFAVEELVTIDNRTACAACKPVLVQCLREGVAVQSEAVSAWQDGKYVVTRVGDDLPDRCIKCNASADAPRLKKTLYYVPSWIWVLILLGLLVVAIAYMIVRKKVPVEIPLCQRHASKRKMTMLIGGLIAFVSMLGLCGGVSLESDLGGILVILSILGFFGGLITLAVVSNPLKPSKYSKDAHVWFSGCSQEYRDSLPRWPG